MKKNENGFAHLGLILIVVLVIGAVGFTGWKVYYKNRNETATQTQKSNTPNPAEKQNVAITKEEQKIPDGFVPYENKELGFKFAYPKEWGDVSLTDNSQAKQQQHEAGDRYSLRFSKNQRFFMALQSKDFKFLVGKDGSSCTPIDGFAITVKPTNLKPYEQREDGTTIVNKMLVDESGLFIAESFEYVAEGSYAIGWCPGLNLYGFKNFEAGKSLPGVSFAWYQDGVNCCSYEIVTKQDAEVYKNNNTSVLSSQERQYIIGTAKSIRSL